MNGRHPLHGTSWHSWRHWVLPLIVTCLITLPAGYFMGQGSAEQEAQSHAGLVLDNVEDLQQALDIALGELEMQRTRNEVDSRALEMLRREMAEERERTAELEEGLSFYRNLVASEATDEGLYLRTPELVPGDEPGRVTYRIFVQQKEREYEAVEGELAVRVSGSVGSDDVSYTLAELSADVEGPVSLQFRYFQSIEGEIVLPEGFEPSELSMVARAVKPHKVEVTEVFPWVLQERLINVGE